LSIAQLNSDNNKVGALMLWGALGVGSIPLHFPQRKSKGIAYNAGHPLFFRQLYNKEILNRLFATS
jgi:hypothetical protein